MASSRATDGRMKACSSPSSVRLYLSISKQIDCLCPPHYQNSSQPLLLPFVNMASTARPTTPLRRISRGSISALSSSRGGPNSSSSSSTPLSFLEGPLGNLADETSILSSNLAELAEIYEALNVFNEGFGGFVYGLKVAAYCIEWAEAPQEENFENAKEREGEWEGVLGDLTSGGIEIRTDPFSLDDIQPPSYATRPSSLRRLPIAPHTTPLWAPALAPGTITQQTRHMSRRTRSASRPPLPHLDGRVPRLQRRTRRRC